MTENGMRGSEDFEPIGGHASKGLGPPLRVEGDQILKPLGGVSEKGGGRDRGAAEVAFYETLQDDKYVKLRRFMPEFYGVEEMDTPDFGTVKYMKLQNLLKDFERACVMDLKMGQRTYGENASAEKIAREKKKYPPQEHLGFRFTGMKVWSNGDWEHVDREWCLAVESKEDVIDGLRKFLNGSPKPSHELASQYIECLHTIRDTLAEVAAFRMYGSSLLFVYDAADQSRQAVHMIDFAHVYDIKDGGKDDGYIHGINYLIDSFRDLAEP
eukprot:Clim_evm96s207 gene=Clim_evmTU96s207